MTEDEMHDRLSKEFGTTIWKWPPIPRRAPKWWQRSLKLEEARVNAALATIGKGPVTDAMRDLFWEQARYGQDVCEDAGGSIWRCWCAAMGLPFRAPTWTYSGYIAPNAEPLILGIDMGAGDDLSTEQMVPTAGAAPAPPGPQPSALADRRSRR